MIVIPNCTDVAFIVVIPAGVDVKVEVDVVVVVVDTVGIPVVFM